jgi:hypothetical protein
VLVVVDVLDVLEEVAAPPPQLASRSTAGRAAAETMKDLRWWCMFARTDVFERRSLWAACMVRLFVGFD